MIIMIRIIIIIYNNISYDIISYNIRGSWSRAALVGAGSLGGRGGPLERTRVS